VDGSAFNNIKEIWLHFKDEPHNLRILLVGGGVNPFEELISIYSVWPILLSTITFLHGSQ
jgi:hypothetical protein